MNFTTKYNNTFSVTPVVATAKATDAAVSFTTLFNITAKKYSSVKANSTCSFGYVDPVNSDYV